MTPEKPLRTQACAALCGALALLAFTTLAPSAASAAPTHLFQSTFNASDAPEEAIHPLVNPLGLAVDDTGTASDGIVYVGDVTTNVIDRFDASGKYLSQINGSETPQGSFASPYAIAVEQSSGDLFVADLGHGAIDKFDPEGKVLKAFGEEGQLTGAATPQGSFGPTAVAIDPTTGELYVADNTNAVIDVFGPSGTYLRQFASNGGELGLAIDSQGNLFAANGTETDVYSLATEALNPAYGAGSGVLDSGGSLGVGVDPATDDVYVADNEHVAQYDKTGAPLSSFSQGQVSGGFGIGVGDSAGRVYVANINAADAAIFGPLEEVEPPAVAIEAPAEVQYTTAQVQGTVNPQGNATTCAFLYVTEEQFQAEGFSGAAAAPCATQPGSGTGPVSVEAKLEGLTQNTTYHVRLHATNPGGATDTAEPNPTFTTKAVAKPTITGLAVGAVTAHTAHFSAQVNPNAPKEAGETDAAEQEAFKTSWHFECTPECPGLEAGEIAADNTAHEVSADATGLTPGLPYEVTLVASNLGGPETAGPTPFTTEAVEPRVDATFATKVSETGAKLGAKVNPGGAATTVHFEYVTLEQFEQPGPEGGFAKATSTPESNTIGSNDEDQTETAEVENLKPGTAYRYRVVATNAKSPSGLPGPTKGFHTTSPSTDFTGKCPANEQLRRENNSTALPDCRAYEMVSPVKKGGYDAVLRSTRSQFPAQASTAGDGIAYMGTGSFPGAKGSGLPNARISTRSSAGWQTTEITPPTARVSKGPFPLGYDFTEDLSRFAIKVAKQPLTEASPPGAEGLYNLYLGDLGGNYTLVNSAAIESPPPGECEAFGSVCPVLYDAVAFAGASNDLSHVLFEADDSLQGTGAPGALLLPNLYEEAGGLVRLVGILPDGEIAVSGSAPGAGGVSAGSGVLYSSAAPGIWRDVDHAISADGKRVLFTALSDEGEKPAEAGQSGMAELYDRVEGNETIEVSAPAPGATPANSNPEPAQFWSASNDGSQVFFASSAELTTASNTGSANNSSDLYRYNVDTEALTDLTVDTNPADAATGAGVQGVVGTSTDGSYIYFVATGELIPGEGEDGQPNLYVSHGGQLEYITTLATADARDWTEIPAELTAYLTPDGHHLAFKSVRSLPSANFPTGYDNTDRSTGEADSEVYAYSAEGGQLLCASCNPSGARPTGPAFIGAQPEHLASTPFHQPRVLSDSGDRLFFSSPDELTPNAGGPFAKIYEYERAGTGSCPSGQGNCLSLISSGTIATNDAFLDASADGRNVFFGTVSRLTPSDEDGLDDVYDARVEGGFAATAAVPPCEGEGCRGSASTAPSGSPGGTATFTGREEGPRHPRCSRGQVKRHGRCVRRKHRGKKHKRANANRRAGR